MAAIVSGCRPDRHPGSDRAQDLQEVRVESVSVVSETLTLHTSFWRS